MYVESYSKADGAYTGYNCIIVDDNGKKHGVLALPREHAGRRDIHNAAFAALKNDAISEKESMLVRAEEIMKEVRTKEASEVPFEDAQNQESVPESAPEIKGLEDEPPMDYSDLKFFELRAYAKERGVKVTRKMKKPAILTALGKLGENNSSDSPAI